DHGAGGASGASTLAQPGPLVGTAVADSPDSRAARAVSGGVDHQGIGPQTDAAGVASVVVVPADAVNHQRGPDHDDDRDELVLALGAAAGRCGYGSFWTG